MKDEDYVDEVLKIGDCGDCCPEGALVESTCEVEDDDTIISDKCPFAIDKADIIDHIKEMDVIPAYGGSK